jgi:hypothetical protein
LNYRKIGLYTTLITSLAFQAHSQCFYKSNDNLTYVGHIESTKVISKKVFPYVDDTRKCRITLQSRIEGQWYPASAEYVFGPDLSESEACSQAETRAKRKIMNEVLPETMDGTKNLNCDLTTVKKSCKVIYMNVLMPVIGEQKVRMETCE